MCPDNRIASPACQDVMKGVESAAAEGSAASERASEGSPRGEAPQITLKPQAGQNCQGAVPHAGAIERIAVDIRQAPEVPGIDHDVAPRIQSASGDHTQLESSRLRADVVVITGGAHSSATREPVLRVDPESG